ncbi:hypothetical protein ADK57_25890 [Streptomyces sp. MMG1533]|uniref:hypothetical protein n=1 Tax=Streptomyces sp. MMG1533 TaxID=1415546 RepID=UPI0006AF6F04|nr:hypothetical protein [Streptomyces sp. MMG1533]KOU62067.1 hypothetical protein ADK57_25890 [Streptomyces sp. MMG1533]
MLATAKLRSRTKTAARTAVKALRYCCISGIVAVLVDGGQLIRTGDALDRFGGGDLPDGQQSWYGRHVAKAYRKTHGGDAIRVWARHRTTGRWIHVHVYAPADPALLVGLRSYKATRHLADRANFAEAA